MVSFFASRKAHSFFLLIIVTAVCFAFAAFQTHNDILSYEADPASLNIKMYLNQENGANYRSLGTLKKVLSEKGQNLVFAMNGGMYMEDLRPLGLYIENGNILRKVNERQNAGGNFYLQPNGIFYLTEERKAAVVSTAAFELADDIKYATQSGPMLLIDGAYHPAFNKGSSNLNIRNGVGILPNGNVLFAMSKSPINFYDFATFFKDQGCKNALYLDGFVSKAYCPAHDWEQLGGNFGVIIGVCE